MFAPASKVLWLATEEKQWDAHYNYWLAKWEGQEILQGELCNMTPGVSMDQRAEKWLVETDELGILLMSLGKIFDPVMEITTNRLSKCKSLTTQVFPTNIRVR